MNVPGALLEAGKFLVDHADIVEAAAKALAGGTPKEAILAAIVGLQVKVSDAAIVEELEAAEARDAGDGSP